MGTEGQGPLLSDFRIDPHKKVRGKWIIAMLQVRPSRTSRVHGKPSTSSFQGFRRVSKDRERAWDLSSVQGT